MWWAEPEVSNVTTAIQVDLSVDLNTMDETGLPWAFLDEAPDPSLIVAGHHIVVGSGAATAVAIVVDITGGLERSSTRRRPCIERLIGCSAMLASCG